MRNGVGKPATMRFIMGWILYWPGAMSCASVCFLILGFSGTSL